MSNPVVTIADSYSVARESIEEEHRAVLRKRQIESDRASRGRRLLLKWSFAAGGLLLFVVMFWR